MPNTITNRQMAFILLLTITSFSTVNIPKLMAQSAGTGSWLTILAASLLFAAAAWLWARLNAMHPGKMLFEYGRDIVGRFGVYLLAVYFSVYFMSVLVNLSISMSFMLRANFLAETPTWVTVLATIPVIGFVAWKGVTNVARLVEIYGVIFLTVAVATHIVMMLTGDLMHILPLFCPAEIGTYLLSVKDAIYPFLGAEVLCVLPVTQKYSRKTGKTAALTLLLIGFFYVLVVETSFMAIEITEIVHYNYPLIAAIRQVELPSLKVFQRLDVMYLTVGFLGLFAGMSVIYMSIVEFICRLVPKAKRGLVVAATGAAAYIIFLALRNVKDIEKILTQIITVGGIVSVFIVPLLLNIVSKAKKHGMQKAG